MEKIETAFNRDLKPIEAALIASLTIPVDVRLDSIGPLVDKAFKSNDTINEITTATGNRAVNSVNVGRKGTAFGNEKIAKPKSIFQIVVNSNYGNQKRPLFQTLNSGGLQDVVEREIRDQILINRRWSATAQGIKNSVKGDLPKYINDLEYYAKKSLKGENLREYRKALQIAEKNISELIGETGGGANLKKAYARILEASKKGQSVAIKRAINRGVREKMRYNAERIARTENFFNYGQAVQQEAINDENIGYLKFKLDPAHNVNDECDDYAHTDMFGLGDGIYPTDEFPALPIHPNGRSLAIELSSFALDDKKPKFNAKSIKDKKNVERPPKFKNYLTK